MKFNSLLSAWLSPVNVCYVAEEGGDVVGTYVLHPNRKGRGSHVANCGYMTARHGMAGELAVPCAHIH